MQCAVCGGRIFKRVSVLWQSLIDEWQLSSAEANYIDRQQGEHCVDCGANLRSIALASALLEAFGTVQLLGAFCRSDEASRFRILEINEAGTLHRTLCQMPGHVFAAYPQVDMRALPYADESFDVVVHSDTLEHVPNPVEALRASNRVLRGGGALCFTVPIVVGRLSKGRDGLAKSFHGNPAMTSDDYVVHTEFGADAWTYVMQAGFQDVRLISLEYPAAIAISARKSLD